MAFVAGPGLTRCAGTLVRLTEGSSSIGRAPVSKTDGCGFKSLLPCKFHRDTGDVTKQLEHERT